MKKIAHYFLYYTPKGNGRVVFRLAGETTNRATQPLSAVELAAAAAVLSQKNIMFDPVQNTFASFDDDNSPLANSNLFA